jgi:hypothetical protein
MSENNKWNRWELTDENANRIIEFTSFLSSDMRYDGTVSTEPLELGGFAAYNKNASPVEGDVVLGIQGEPDELQDALDKLADLRGGTDRFSLITPEREYRNMTLESFNFTRKREDGLNSLYVELRLVEIREVTPQYANVALPPSKCRNSDNAGKANTGKAQVTEGPKPYNSILSGKGNK